MSNEQAEQPKEYRIETVADFAQVPSERLEECLKEFEIFLRTMFFGNSLSNDLGIPKLIFPVFRWIDDSELIVRFHFKEKVSDEQK